MQFTSTFFALLATAFAVAPALAQPPTPTVLNYDKRFDDPTGSFGSTTCSANPGPFANFPNFGSLPSFPRIAGSFLVEGFNSSHCGACYELSYNRADGNQVVLPFTVINQADRGFISSVAGMKALTGLEVNEFPGDALISYKEVHAYHCGL